MFRNAAAPIRILVLLVVFLASSAGHHAAMAAAFPIEVSAVETPSLLHGAAGHRHNACTTGHCAGADQSCCVTGQCMAALNPRVNNDLSDKAIEATALAACEAVRAGPLDLPFRPPVA